MSEYIDRPNVPKAASFHAAFCEDPNCGLHIIPLDINDKPICEVVMSPESTLGLMKACAGHLYAKATKRI